MDLLECEEDACERRVERRGHSSRRAAGDEEALLSPVPSQRARDGLAGHAAELDGRSLSPQGEARERERGALDELGGDHAVPGHVELPHDLGVHLRDARPRRGRLPAHEPGDERQQRREDDKPAEHAHGAGPGYADGPPQQALGRREGHAVEAHDRTGDEAHQRALDHEADLEAS